MNESSKNNYTYRVEKQNKTDIVFSVSAYISAAVLYFPSIFVDGIKYVPVLQFLALTALVVGIYINVRYTWVRFVYGIVPLENKNSGETAEYTFIVYRVQGRRQSCLAKINVSDCIRLIPCTHKENHKNELSDLSSPARYNFRATMFPAKYCRAVFRADGGIAVIDFEPDETLYTIMKYNMDNSEKAEKGADEA